VDEALVAFGLRERLIQREGLIQESLHLGVAAGWTLAKIASASRANFSLSAAKKRAIVSAGNASANVQFRIERLGFLQHSPPTSLPATPVIPKQNRDEAPSGDNPACGSPWLGQ